MPYGRKRKDGSSKYRDPSDSFGRSVPEFTIDYDGNRHIDQWGQLGLKYAPFYSSKRTFTKHAQSMADSSSCGDTASRVHNEKFAQQIKRRKIALILVVVGLVAIAVAIIPILVITLKPADSQPDKILVVKMNASVDQPFISQYKDESSLEYKSFEKNFTNAMDQIYRNSDIKGYNGFQILELKNGSIIVIFIIVIEIKHAEDPPQEKALEAVITGQRDYPDDNTYVLVTTFKILKLSVSVVSSQEVSVNPIPTSTVITLPPTTKSTAASTTTFTSASSELPTTSTKSSTTPLQNTTTPIAIHTTKQTTASTTSPSTLEPNTYSSISTSTINTPSNTVSTTSLPKTAPNTTNTTESTSAATTTTTEKGISTLTIPKTSTTTSTDSTTTTLTTTTTVPTSSTAKSTSTETKMSTTSTMEPTTTSPATTTATIATSKPSTTTILTTTSTTTSTTRTTSSLGTTNTTPGETSTTAATTTFTTTSTSTTMASIPTTFNTTSGTSLTTTSTSPETTAIGPTTTIATTTKEPTSTRKTTLLTTTQTSTETTATPKLIYFVPRGYVALIGSIVRLTCVVSGWNGKLNISRISKLDQQEVLIVSFSNNETGNILNGFTVNTTFSEGSVNVSISNNMSCDNEGTYYCRSGMVGDYTTVNHEREIPQVQLPDIMVLNAPHDSNYPFVCEGEVENSGEILIAEVKRNGTFNVYIGDTESRTNSTTDCRTKQKYTFYIKERFTPDWDNTTIRCVSVNNMTNGESDNIRISAEEMIRLLPANICANVANGSNILHPHRNCEWFLTCQANGPVLGKCPKGQCFSGSFGSCRLLMMCEGAVVILGGSASITCRFLFCGQSFSLAITHSEKIIFSENNISSSIHRPSNNTDIQISIRQQGEAMVNLTLHQVKFNDSGEYIINLDGGNLTEKAKLTLKEDTTSTSGTTITTPRGYTNATTSFTMTPPTSNETITNTTIISSTTTTPVQTTTTGIEISVAFNRNNYTSKLGTPLQLICIVIGWNGNLSISRTSKLNQSEVIVMNLVNNKTVSIYPDFAVNRTFSEGKLNVFVSILNMTCDDEETYYCRSGSASDVATVKREREIPKLQLPDIMIRDEFHIVGYPFLCEGDIENPGDILIAEVNRNGTFYFYEGYKETRDNITADCVKKQRFKFYINGKFTQDWDNAKIRCVAISNMTNGNTGIRLVSEEKTVRLVPADICVGVTQGSNISHPQSDCELFLTCQTGVPVLGKCQQGECFFDNIGKCRPPTCPFVYCRDAEVNIGDKASITCSLLFCNDSFSLSIKHSEDILFSNSNITSNISQSLDNRDITISVTRGRGEVIVTLIKTDCNHSGEYIIILDRGNFTDRAYLTLKVRPGRPTLKLPQSIVASTQANITCTGEQGVPQQNMYMEVMFSGSNFSKYENTMLTTNSYNCSNMGTLVMNFLVVEKWHGARVRCVIGDNSTSRLESDVHEINTTRSGVNFSPSEITGYINDTVQMNCTVTGILSGDAVIISRLIHTIGGEEVLSIITFGNATKNNLTGINFSTTVLSAHDMILHITINFLQCSDGGTYYCKTGNRTAATSLAIWSKPAKPNLLLPLDVVSGGFNQLGDPFVCEGNVGYPGGKLLSLINSNGSFREVQPFKVSLTKGNVSSCQKVDRFEFYLEKFTTDLHNSTVRCVATNNETLPIGQSAPYDEKVLLLVPGNTCYGVTNGVHLPYPYQFYDCGKYLFCSGNRTFVRDGKCKVGECYYTDMSICDKERTTTTTEPTTTTQRTCPSITCLGAETVINSAATINCEMLVCGNDFDLTIELESKVQFIQTIRGNHSSQFLSNAHIDLVVNSLKANLSIVFENVLCNQSGVYNISIYGRNTSNVATLKVRVNPEKPNITAPPNIYKGQKAIFTCIGQLGIPNASMFWQLMLPGGNFESYGVKGSPNILKSDCSVIGNWTIEVYPEEIWNGSSIRCVTKAQGNPATETYSDTILITLKQADIYFVPLSSSGYIGSQHSITCQARDMTNITSVKIERQTASGVREEVVTIALDGSKTSNFNGIRINSTSTINKTIAAIHVNFDNLTCTDKGDYFCTIGEFSSRGRVDVLSLPKKPTIALPLQLIDGSAFLIFTCTGEVGYPAGYIVAETNRSGAFVEYSFDRKTPKVDPGNCSTTYTLEFGNNVTRVDWNNTAMRCVTKSNNTMAGSTPITSDEVTIRLIPANFCVGRNVTNYKHPYVCQRYVACAGEGTNLRPVVSECGNLCFNPTFNGCDHCDNVAGCNII